MTPLPVQLGGSELVAWRVDRQEYASTWTSGEGARRLGGRWNSVGTRAIYCSLDPATAILEVAVHKGFDVLDTQPHTLTRLRIDDPAQVRIVQPSDIPNPNWLVPGTPGKGQQQFGDTLLATHPFVAIPSAVSRNSWNLVFVHGTVRQYYSSVLQTRLEIDTRLNPPASAT